MALINRWYQILELLNAHGEMSLEEMQKMLGISPQTVKKSVDLLNDELIGIATITESKKQYQLKIINEGLFDEILTGKLREESDFNSSTKRTAYILKRLVSDHSYIIMDDLSEELGVSRGTVSKDLKAAKLLAAEYDLTISGTPNRGLMITGGELDLRLLYLHQVEPYFQEELLDEETFEFVGGLAEKAALPRHTTNLLGRVVALSTWRVNKGFPLVAPIDYFVNQLSEDQVLEELYFFIEETQGFTLSQYERDFISFPLHLTELGKVDKEKLQEEQVKTIFTGMMTSIKERWLIELDDDRLYEELRIHLLFLINRLIFRIDSNDLFYGEIERKYPFAYEMAKTGADYLGKVLKRKVIPAEIGYLALYFELVIRDPEAEASPKEIAIICSTGRGTAMIIRRQIERIVGNDVKITQYSEDDYRGQDLNQFFAIFSVIPLKNVDASIPVIHLTRLFNDDWLREEWQKATQTRKQHFEMVDFHFTKVAESKSYLENLQLMCQDLQAENYVDEGFYQRLLQREKLQTTIFGDGIAFPHAINNGTDKIILSLGSFKEGKESSEGYVEVIFMLGIPEVMTSTNEAELIDIYDNIITVLSQPNVREELKQLENTESFVALMKRKEIL